MVGMALLVMGGLTGVPTAGGVLGVAGVGVSGLMTTAGVLCVALLVGVGAAGLGATLFVGVPPLIKQVI